MTPITHKDIEHEVDRAITAREKACDQRLLPIEAAIIDIRAMRVELTTACTEMKTVTRTVKKLDRIICGADGNPDDAGIAGDVREMKPIFLEVKEVKPVLDSLAWGKKQIRLAIGGIIIATAPGWVAAIVVAIKEAIRFELIGG